MIDDVEVARLKRIGHRLATLAREALAMTEPTVEAFELLDRIGATQFSIDNPMPGTEH